jgi:hypothetical protein
MIVIIAIVCLTIGYVFGWLISMLRSSKEDKKNALDARIGSVPPLTSEPAAVDKAALRLSRDAEKGALQVDLDGSRIGNATNLTMEQRQRLENLLRETANWMGLSYQLGAPAAEPLQAVSVLPVRRATGPLDPADAPVDPADAARPSSLISGVTTALADAMVPAVKKPAPKSIVEQIDEVLQGMLPGTLLENEKVYLAESPSHGVVVRVGAQVYEGIDAVPEGEVKKLLRAAVAEWEKQQEKMLRRTTG